VAPPIVAGGSVWAGAHSFDLGLLTQLMAPFFTVAGGYDPSDGSRVSDNVISAGYPAEAGAEIFGYADNNISVGFGPGNRFQDYPTIDAVAEDGSSTRTVLVNPPFGAISVAGDRLYLALGGSVEVYDTKPATIPCAPAPGAPPGYPQYDVCTPLWSAVLHHTPSLDGLPVVANGLLYVSEVDGSVEVFDVAGCGTATCAPVWTARAGTVHVGELAVTGTTLFVPSDDGHLYAFPSTGCGASTCTPAWSVNAGSGTHAPAVAGSVVVAGTQDGRVIAVDARGCGSSTCPVLRSVAVGSPVRQPIAVSNGRVFALSDDGVLHGLAVG
jgi:outer membrane protein assembly factor BamB